MNTSDLSETLTLAPPPELEAALELDAGNVVEEAEQMLRESAPHDFDLLVIGGGPGGMAAAIRAAELGAHVGLVEEREIGGAHLHRGCMAARALLESVEVLRVVRHAREFGIAVGEAKIDFAAMQKRKRRVLAELREGLEASLQKHNVEVIAGHARFVGEHIVEIESANEGAARRINAVHIVIATGSVAARPAISGVDLPGVVTCDELLQTEIVPQNLVAIGANAAGLELASLFHELGARVAVLEAAPQILPQEESEIAGEIEQLLRARGLNLVTKARLERIEEKSGALNVVFGIRQGNRKTEQALPAQTVLLSARRPDTQSLNLDEVGIAHNAGLIAVDENCETSVAGVYAIGDCIHANGAAHLAAGEGTLVAERILRHLPCVDLIHVPRCYRVFPEAAFVGLTRLQAKAKGMDARSGQLAFVSNAKAVAAGERQGAVGIVIEAETEILLGCQIVGRGASEWINLAVLALKTGQTVDEFVGALFAHPSFSEMLSQAARNAREPDDGEKSTP